MHMTDYEKLQAFEEWLADDGQNEPQKKQKYPIISVLVENAARKRRIFQTNAYTMRSLIVMLERYAGDFRIISWKYGNYNCPCPNWDQNYEPCDEEGLMPASTDLTKAELLRKYDYRTAMNMVYCLDAFDGRYPSKSPFRGVKVWHRGDHSQFANRRYPFFIPCEEDGGDCLRLFEGRLIERIIDGEKVRGYYITAPRIMEEKDDFFNA